MNRNFLNLKFGKYVLTNVYLYAQINRDNIRTSCTSDNCTPAQYTRSNIPLTLLSFLLFAYLRKRLLISLARDICGNWEVLKLNLLSLSHSYNINKLAMWAQSCQSIQAGSMVLQFYVCLLKYPGNEEILFPLLRLNATSDKQCCG